jgi:hypothetical protein
MTNQTSILNDNNRTPTEKGELTAADLDTVSGGRSMNLQATLLKSNNDTLNNIIQKMG